MAWTWIPANLPCLCICVCVVIEIRKEEILGGIILLFLLNPVLADVIRQIPASMTSEAYVHKWETWDSELNVTGNLTTYSNVSFEFPSGTDSIGFSFNTNENVPQITTTTGNLLLNPTAGVQVPYGKTITIGDLAGFSRLFLTTAGTHGLVSTGSDLRLTTYRNLEIKASNTIFPAVNAITYLLASNAARYNEMRACYGSGTGATKYTSVWHDGTNGNVRSSSGDLILTSNNTVVQVKYNLTIGASGYPGCLQMRDSGNGGWTKCTTLAGIMNCSVGTC